MKVKEKRFIVIKRKKKKDDDTMFTLVTYHLGFPNDEYEIYIYYISLENIKPKTYGLCGLP